MGEENEAKASHEDVRESVGELKGFRGTLKPLHRHALVAILEGNPAGDRGGDGARIRRYGGPSGGVSGSRAEGWDDPNGRIEGQGEEDTRGFAVRLG